MSNKKQNQKKTNPLLFAALGVGVIAVAVLLFAPEKKQGTQIANEVMVTDTKEVATSNEGADSGNTPETVDIAEPETISSNEATPAILNENGDLVIQVADITEKSTFYEYDANGTKMAVFAVKASDGTVRTAFDTCQVCNGSPYAFFVQQGDQFQCQNCGNIYSLDMIGRERGGCNPIPIMNDEKTVTDTEIIIPAKLLEDNATKFENWKNF